MRRSIAAALLAVVAAWAPRPTDARPQYFAAVTEHYGLVDGDELYACGICHRIWTGTGARNPFGRAVEDQLYLGKPILTVIADIASGDADGDGFTNDDELRVYRTLPGFSCSNFDLAIDPPSYFQSIITPAVPTCLEPKDVKVDPTTIDFVTEAG